MTQRMRDLENQEIGADKADRQRIEIMLRDGKSAEAIADFCKYPISLVKEVEQSMLVVS